MGVECIPPVLSWLIPSPFPTKHILALSFMSKCYLNILHRPRLAFKANWSEAQGKQAKAARYREHEHQHVVAAGQGGTWPSCRQGTCIHIHLAFTCPSPPALAMLSWKLKYRLVLSLFHSHTKSDFDRKGRWYAVTPVRGSQA